MAYVQSVLSSDNAKGSAREYWCRLQWSQVQQHMVILWEHSGHSRLQPHLHTLWSAAALVQATLTIDQGGTCTAPQSGDLWAIRDTLQTLGHFQALTQKPSHGQASRRVPDVAAGKDQAVCRQDVARAKAQYIPHQQIPHIDLPGPALPDYCHLHMQPTCEAYLDISVHILIPSQTPMRRVCYGA